MKQRILHERKRIDLYDTANRKTASLSFPKNHPVKIVTNVMKRMEIEHIEEAMVSRKFDPDFGFDNLMEDDELGEGWELFLMLIQRSDKFERVQNYIHMRLYEKDQVV